MSQCRRRRGAASLTCVLSWLSFGAVTDEVFAAEAVPALERATTAARHFYGPLRARDLTPFGYLRLDMRPAFSGEIAPGKWAVESELGFQNTWALSGRVEEYLRRFPERRSLTADDVAALRAMPGESYLVDLELAELDVTLHRQFTHDLGAYAIVSGAAYGGGELDGLVEQIHSAFGRANMGRRGVERGQMNVVMNLDSLQYASLDAHSRSGLLDPTLGLRYTGVSLPAPWSVVLEAAVKVPLAGERQFLSTGRLDAGVQASFMRRGVDHALYGSVSIVDYAGSDGDAQPDARVVPTLILGLESHLTRRVHSIVQVYASPSIYDDDDTSLRSLTSNKYLLSLGLRYHYGAQLFTFAVTENLANMSNTPDVGFQLGWAYRPYKIVTSD
jgi:hypothetical protein